jgi:hypothetical protein
MNAGYEIRTVEETMTIFHFGINAFEEIEIMKAIAFDQMLNIIQNNNPLYQILQPLQDQTTTSRDKYLVDLILMKCLQNLIHNFSEKRRRHYPNNVKF